MKKNETTISKRSMKHNLKLKKEKKMKTSKLFNATKSSKKIKTLKEENKMKKITITTITSIIIVLFVFSSISYAFEQDAWVKAHNKYRSLHKDTDEVFWSTELAQKAQIWADRCEGGHAGEHPEWQAFIFCKDPRGYYCDTDNIAYSPSGHYSNAEEVVKAWYDEIIGYDYNDPPEDIFYYEDKYCNPNDPPDVYEDCSEFYEIGHFTQVVWRGTKKIGCNEERTTHCESDFWVCQYSPGGNVTGQFKENVGPLKATLWASSGYSTILDNYRAPYLSNLPGDKKPENIVGVGIAYGGLGIDSESHVYVWYDDYDVSVGTSWDLGKHRGNSNIEDRNFDTYVIPEDENGVQRSPENIVGMGISSDGRVFVWYDDYTFSVGQSDNLATDLIKRKLFNTYKIPEDENGVQRSPENIVGIGIGSECGMMIIN
jgi:uncharacterized protein YkwD